MGNAAVELTPQGHVILAQCVDDCGFADALIMTGGYAPFVIARNFNEEDGTWGGGSYFASLRSAYEAWQEFYGGR